MTGSYWDYLRAYYRINRETEWKHGRLGRVASFRDAHRLARRIARCARQERRAERDAALTEGGTGGAK